MELVKWNEARRAIAEAHSVDEIKNIRDWAEATRYALIQAKEAPEVIRQAEEIKLRAERRAGEKLKDMEKNKGAATQSQATIALPPKLKDLGISLDQSSKWQRIADIPEEKFEKFIAESQEITTSGVLRISREIERLSRKYEEKEMPKGVFDLIYCDPPWRYEHCETYSREVENQYPTMSLEKICSMKLPDNFYNTLSVCVPIKKLLEVCSTATIIKLENG